MALTLVVPRSLSVIMTDYFGSMIASCSQDGDVIIWTQDQEAAGAEWVAKILHTFQDTVWRVSWSITGNILAATTADNKVTLWKESLDGEWKLVKELQS